MAGFELTIEEIASNLGLNQRKLGRVTSFPGSEP